MISWIKSFFDSENELAMDVRNEYLDLLRAGVSARNATRQTVEGFSEEAADFEVAELTASNLSNSIGTLASRFRPDRPQSACCRPATRIWRKTIHLANP